MNRAFGLGFLVAGLILMIAGIQASQSFSSDLARFFTGAVTQKAMWLTSGGLAIAVAGLVLFSRGRDL